ncbi:hypothetical protein Taro_021055, partial [Colocasia esculenta]|nr:hypothetical protein [Colocasia esculenta]
MLKKGKAVGSDDSTQSLDDDDGGDGAAAAGTGATGMDGKVAWVGAESPESESGRRPATRLGGGSGQDPRSPVSRAGSAGSRAPLSQPPSQPPAPPPPAGAATLAATGAGAPRRVAAGRRRRRHCKSPAPVPSSLSVLLSLFCEVLEPREVMGLGVLCQDMKIIHNHPNNNKEAKGKHNSNMGDMKANKGKQGIIGDM